MWTLEQTVRPGLGITGKMMLLAGPAGREQRGNCCLYRSTDLVGREVLFSGVRLWDSSKLAVTDGRAVPEASTAREFKMEIMCLLLIRVGVLFEVNFSAFYFMCRKTSRCGA